MPKYDNKLDCPMCGGELLTNDHLAYCALRGAQVSVVSKGDWDEIVFVPFSQPKVETEDPRSPGDLATPSTGRYTGGSGHGAGVKIPAEPRVGVDLASGEDRTAIFFDAVRRRGAKAMLWPRNYGHSGKMADQVNKTYFDDVQMIYHSAKKHVIDTATSWNPEAEIHVLRKRVAVVGQERDEAQDALDEANAKNALLWRIIERLVDTE